MIELDAGGQRWQAIIDTGFNGELEVPERLRSRLNARFIYAPLRLARHPVKRAGSFFAIGLEVS